jgi:hypothetical protein
MLFKGLALLLLTAGGVAADSLVPPAFFLVNRELSEVRWTSGVSSSLGRLYANATSDDVVLSRLPISYTGSIAKPYDRGLPLEERHGLYARVPGHHLTFGLSPSVGINTLSNTSSQTVGHSRPGGEGLPDASYTKTATINDRCAQLTYAGTANLGLRVRRLFIVGTAAGRLSQQFGYRVSSQTIDNREMHIAIRDYNPNDVSYGATGGLMCVRKATLLNRPWHLFVGAQGVYDKQRALVRGSPVPALDDDLGVSLGIDYIGSTRTETVGTGWVGLRPALPMLAAKEHMLYRGRHIHGLTLDEVHARARYAIVDQTDYRFSAVNARSSGNVDSMLSGTETAEISAGFTPALFITRNVSLTIPVYATVFSERMEIDPVYPVLPGRTGGHASVSANVRVSVPVANAARIDINAGTGKLVANFVLEPRHYRPSDYRWRAYTASIGVALVVDAGVGARNASSFAP